MLRTSALIGVAALLGNVEAGGHGPSWGPPGWGPPSWGSPSGSGSSSGQNQSLISDISVISQYWGQLSTYRDNADNYFGVQDVGLPDGCQVEQVHTLQRHAQRFPTSAFDDGANNERFAEKLTNFTTTASGKFTGPLTFLNSYRYQMGESLLTNLGANTEFASGASFWNRYGRTLFNATKGQVVYNTTYINGTARPKPVLRTTSQSRIWNSAINWALGFFGPSFYPTPRPTLSGFVDSTTANGFTEGSWFDVVVIPEGGTENNTLASYDSCFNDYFNVPIYDGDEDMFLQYVPLYIKDATARVNQYAPEGFRFNDNDTYAMQSICAYETGYIGQSDFCGLFTLDEWAGFEQSLDIEYYYDYAWGNPTGRAQGVGYQQELIARLTNQYITTSNSSVNSSLTDNARDFPLGRPFYADFTHDDIIISVLTSLSIDYFRSPKPSLTAYPPDPNRPFILSHLTPFGGRLITEVIGCGSADPPAQPAARVQYYPGQYGYDAADAAHKFVRMRVNNGIVPLASIRTGECAGRSDGLCALEAFVAASAKSAPLANYDFACFANYTINTPYDGRDWDGTISNSSSGIVVHPGEITAAYIDSL